MNHVKNHEIEGWPTIEKSRESSKDSTPTDPNKVNKVNLCLQLRSDQRCSTTGARTGIGSEVQLFRTEPKQKPEL